jgi:formylglycine-generating enzyme required for sulfatase activity
MNDLPVDEDELRKFDAEIRVRADWGEGRKTVGSFPNGATPEGLCDMVGGVWEWCEDWYSWR